MSRAATARPVGAVRQTCAPTTHHHPPQAKSMREGMASPRQMRRDELTGGEPDVQYASRWWRGERQTAAHAFSPPQIQPGGCDNIRVLVGGTPPVQVSVFQGADPR